MAINRGPLLIIFLLWLLFYSGSTGPSDAPPLLPDFSHPQLIEQERASLSVLNRSRYGDFNPPNQRYLNLTGLDKEYGYVWDALPKAKEKAKYYTDVLLGENGKKAIDGRYDGSFPLFHNLTGLVRGPWVKSALQNGLTKPNVNLSAIVPEGEYASPEWTRNITGPEGRLKLEFVQKDDGLEIKDERDRVKARKIKAHLEIKDETSWGDGWDVRMFGVHYPEMGSVLLTTTSEKFGGIFALPHFAPSEYMFSTARELLNITLNQTIEQHSKRPDDWTNPWSSNSESSSETIYSLTAPHCEFIMYLQQYPVSDDLRSTPVDWLQPIEKELRFPNGYPHAAVPEMAMTMVAFSPDCGFVIESKGFPDHSPQEAQHLRGSKIEVLLNTARYHLLIFVAVLIAQVQLMSSQMKEASTPSTRSRISFNTIAMMTMADGCVVLSSLPFSYLFDSLATLIMAAAFFALLAIPFFGMRFLMDIYMIQRQENRRRETRPRPSDSENTATEQPATPTSEQTRPIPVITAAGADTLPLPVTARQAASSGATPMILPPDQDEPATTNNDTNEPTIGELRRVYVKYCLFLMAIIMFSLYASSWKASWRSAYVNSLSFIYLSFWCPQIYRNIMRNCRKALLWRFVIGQSILRLVPFVYFYAVPSNVLWFENDRRALLVLAGWQWIQVWALWIQEIIGPRIFVKASWAPPAYDYHPVLRDDEEGALLPIGFTQAGEEGESPTSPKAAESKDKGKRVWDCAICMQDIEVSVLGAEGGDPDGSTIAGNLLGRRAYMVTPCRHIFHTPCLEGWIRYRLQCPICRETLPPL